MTHEIKNVSNEYELDRSLSFAQSVFVNHKISNKRNIWLERMHAHKELLLYADMDEEVIAVVLAYVEINGNIIIEIVATDERHQGKGIAREMMLLIEERAKNLGVL